MAAPVKKRSKKAPVELRPVDLPEDVPAPGELTAAPGLPASGRFFWEAPAAATALRRLEARREARAASRTKPTRVKVSDSLELARATPASGKAAPAAGWLTSE